MLEYPIRQLAGESNIQPSRLVRHDVNPVGLHAFARDCTRLETSGADSSGLTEAVLDIFAALMFGSRNSRSLCRRCDRVKRVAARGDVEMQDCALSLLSLRPNRNPILRDLPSRIPTASLGEQER